MAERRGGVDRGLVSRIWNRDPAVWGPGEDDPAERLGWLDLPATMAPEIGRLAAFAEQATAGVSDVVLLGMGGSSLAPEVFAHVLGPGRGRPRLIVLDSTHPEHIAGVEASVDPGRALFVVSSKSGTTIETMSLYRHFRERAGAEQFVAITDPGTPLEEVAAGDGWSATFINPPDIGGRYSGLSLFGLVPAALLGADLSGLLEGAAAMARACRVDASGAANPGFDLGRDVGALALEGRDKLTFITSERSAALADWVEQLIAESSGKEGLGIVPVVREPAVDAGRYGDDRAFVNLRFAGDTTNEARARGLEAAGHPVITIDVPDETALGAEMFRWEFATAVACSILGVNAFDQPDVESAKRAAKEALGAPGDRAWPEDDPAALFEGIAPDELACLLVFAAPSARNATILRDARNRLVGATGVATSAGFGPRYLHSTGQLHKGGPKGVRALVVLDEPEEDVDIPGAPYGFARLLAAQARGDADALAAAGKQVLRTTWSVFEEWARP